MGLLVVFFVRLPKVTGEDIDVDFWDDSAEYFDAYFYTKYLESLRDPVPPEQRLLELHRSVRSVNPGIGLLFAAGALSPLNGSDSHPLRIADEVLIHIDSIQRFCLAWADPAKRIWLGGLVGDWLAAHESAAGLLPIQRITELRAARCRSIRSAQLRQVQGFSAADALFGLAELGVAEERLEAVFRGVPDGTVSAALEIVAQQNDPRWCPHIHALFQRLNPHRPLPEPHIWVTSLQFLLRLGYGKDELKASLAEAGGAVIGEVVLLALEHAPEQALSLIRKGLISDIPCNRTTTAATLALIAKPWSVRELVRALEASDDQHITADARAALLEIGGADVESTVLAWEEKNPHEAEVGDYLEIDGRRVGPFYSLDEHLLRERASWVRYEMQKLYERVASIKSVLPPEPTV